ncbi:MAG: hypothetical protein U1U88_001748 [Lawsonella clevelandensis]
MCEHSTLLHSCRLRPTRTSKISGCGLAGGRFPSRTWAAAASAAPSAHPAVSWRA